LERLLEMHEEYLHAVKLSDGERLQGVRHTMDRELNVNEEEQAYLDRCDAGLFTLQQVDVVLIRLMNMGNRQVCEMISELLDAKGVSHEEVKDVINEYIDNLDESAKEEKKELRKCLSAFMKRTENR